MRKSLLLPVFLLSLLITVCSIIISYADNLSDTYKIMSFNIRYGSAKDGDNAWPKRKELLFEVIKAYNPVILGVQEALDFQLSELAKNFIHFKKSGVGRDDGRFAGEHAAIFFDSTKFNLVREETFWFSETPEKQGSLSWDANFPRICSWVELADKTSGQHLFIFNNHWDHQSQLSRNNSAQALINKIKALNIPAKPVVIMGDFNAGENNPAFKKLLSNDIVNFTDSFRVINPAEEIVGTFNGFQGVSNGKKIDAILISGAFKVTDADIIRTNKDGFYPSDHFPITAELILKE